MAPLLRHPRDLSCEVPTGAIIMLLELLMRWALEVLLRAKLLRVEMELELGIFQEIIVGVLLPLNDLDVLLPLLLPLHDLWVRLENLDNSLQDEQDLAPLRLRP